LLGAGSVAGAGVPAAAGVGPGGVTAGAVGLAVGSEGGVALGPAAGFSGPFWPHALNNKTAQARQKLTTIEGICRGRDIGSDMKRSVKNSRKDGSTA
jgi:hypothetical protein